MSLDSLREKLQHGLETKEFSVNDPSSSLSTTHKEPEQIHPEIDQNKRESHKQQTGDWIFARGADTAPIFHPVAGLDTETVFLNEEDGSFTENSLVSRPCWSFSLRLSSDISQPSQLSIYPLQNEFAIY